MPLPDKHCCQREYIISSQGAPLGIFGWCLGPTVSISRTSCPCDTTECYDNAVWALTCEVRSCDIKRKPEQDKPF